MIIFLIRLSSLVAKLMGVVFLARFLGVDDYAVFGVSYALVSYAVYALGLNFYSYSSRSCAGGGVNVSSAILSHGVVVFFSFLIAFFLSMIFWDYLPGFIRGDLNFLFLLVVVLFFEQAAQELYNYLVVCGERVAAGIAYFFRIGFWPSACCVFLWWNEELRAVKYVLLFWVVGSVAATIVSLIYLRGYISLSKLRFDFAWVRKGIAVSLIFFFSSLLVRGILSLDRVWIGDIAGLGSLAAYVFYANLANSLISFLEASAFSVHYPSLVLSFKSGNGAVYLRELHVLKRKVLFGCLVFSALYCLAVPYLIQIIGKPDFYQNYNYSWLVLIYILFFSLGMIWQYALYSAGLDVEILLSHLAGAAFFCLAWVWGGVTSGEGVILSLAGSFFIILIVKFFCYKKINSLSFVVRSTL